jgi:TonB family protein
MYRLIKLAFGLALVCVCAMTHTAAAQSGAARKQPEQQRTEQEAKQKDDAQTDEQKTYHGPEVTKRARILAKPNPDYPRRARESNVEGEVVLRIILLSSGEVSDEVTVIRGLPEGVTEAAIKAARKIKFTPAEKDGRPVSQSVTVVYNFNLY